LDLAEKNYEVLQRMKYENLGLVLAFIIHSKRQLSRSDAFDIDHNNLIDAHIPLPREKKE
jgi:hypothetical protein